VVEVVIRGLERVPESIVRDSIGVRVGELLSDERLRADVAALIATGWFADANVRVEPVRDGARVAFVVVENPVVTQIVFEGNTVFPAAELEKLLDLPTGQVLNIVRLRDGTRAIEKRYEERGYVLARVSDIGITANGEVRLRLRISEGRVEAVEYKGLNKTKRFVVDRGALVRPGGLFNINDLNKDLQRLVNLDLFENVQARPRPGSAPDQVIVEIEVREQRTQQARFGFGYGEQTGFVGLVEYSEKNWQGRNQSITLRVERGLGERNVPTTGSVPASNFTVIFRDPWFDARQTTMEIALYQTTISDVEYTGTTVTSRYNLERLGSTIAFTRPVPPDASITLRLRSERALITPLALDATTAYACSPPPDPLCPAPVNFTPGRSVVLSLSGNLDRRDSRVAPTRGDRLSLTVDMAVRALGGDFSFGKYSVEYARYFSLGPGALVGRVLVGYSHGGLPLQEQFFLGGPSTLRAFPIGRFRGNDVALANLEYRVPLGGLARQLRDFTGIVYVDAGSAPISSGIQLGYGVAMTVNTRVGLIRVDAAWAAGGQQTWLTIGQPF
jgi:outer membrane protein insertion porin family